MAQPVWVTPAGSLGTVPEGVFFQVPIKAYDPGGTFTGNITVGSSTVTNVSSFGDIAIGRIVAGYGIQTGSVVTNLNTTSKTITLSSAATENATGETFSYTGGELFYEVIAGSLPAGIQCDATGLIVGIPKAVVSVQGVPAEVSEDVTSKFAARVYTKKTINGVQVVDRLSDRTFTLTVTGQDAPEFITPPGQIAQYYDGSLVEGLQIEYTDTDPADTVTVKLIAGKLPTGLTITNKGLISGFIQPLAPIDATAGFSRDGQGYAEYPFDFTTQSIDANYEFVLEVSDGKVEGSNLRTFSIFVWSRNSLTADNTVITADNTFITADVTPVRVPILLNPQGSIGTVRNDNFYAYKFNGLDLDGDPFQYELGYDIGDSTDLPGLTLDPNTGWLYGYIPNLGLTEFNYNFYVRLFKTENPSVISDPYYYSLSITGPVNTDIIWLTDSNLGTIVNGSTSILYVKAENAAGIPILYKLESGSDSSLPQGLSLLPSGDIAGRVSFNTFALDGGTTVFDVNLNDLSVSTINTETTFDLSFTFTVVAYSVDGLISVNKIFTITVIREYNEPYENLYIQAMPPQNDRDLIASLLQNADIFQNSLLYRPTDPNFGRATQVIYNHAFGLTASTLDDYVNSLDINHYWKNLTLGSIEVAQATNSAGEVIYEVVYSRVKDDLVNDRGESVSKDVTLPYPINEHDSTEISTVYPNSLINMRDQVIDQIGQVSNILPLWMLSKQANGRVLGFTPAWVLAYALPGKGEQIAYYINEQFGPNLNLIDFEVDRYELDRLLTHNWDPIADSTGGMWVPSPATLTTFDIDAHYQITSFSAGTGYRGIEQAPSGNIIYPGDEILILGSQVGGTDTINDIIIRVNTVNEFGAIISVFCTGTAPLVSAGETWTSITGTNITGTGVGAIWNFESVGDDPTVFDGNSLKFEAPVDMYSNTQEYDKYLVFPNRTILGNNYVK